MSLMLSSSTRNGIEPEKVLGCVYERLDELAAFAADAER
jgi:hypothetical protein